ncbi:MAG TPA: C4-dicarboxylate ABC transporter, partial [Alphaproteobacteria bacterium]|nr:C4-dicarboxylate ABC transporter [Alphaproteobacteria bacterium]
GYQLANQNFEWVFPYHPGAIRYYKEAGVWDDAAQASQEANMQRQDVLAGAWAEFQNMDVSDNRENKWLEVRAKHLNEAGMSVPFREPLAE